MRTRARINIFNACIADYNIGATTEREGEGGEAHVHTYLVCEKKCFSREHA